MARREAYYAVKDGHGPESERVGVETACCQAYSAMEFSPSRSNTFRWAYLRRLVDRKGDPMATKTHERIVEAVLKALEANKDRDSFGMLELEKYGGPAAGAAGGVVRRWPEDGVEVKRNGHHLQLTFGREGRKSVVRVEDMSLCSICLKSGCSGLCIDQWSP